MEVGTGAGTEASTRSKTSIAGPVASIVKRRSLLVPILVVVVLIILFIAFSTVTASHRPRDILATVNGEPIYASDIEDTVKLLPEQYRTDQNRESFLNQTIDLLLLKQEAERRAITVAEIDVDNRIETVLNDTGRSPQELRLILADRNLTVEEFRRVIRDGLLVEFLTKEAITSRITVSEQEIVEYFNTNREQFTPPPGSARLSHIFVESERAANDIIAALNRGERFRDLAREHSLDTETALYGGALGVVSPTSNYPAPFIDAGLALNENQYTRTPVRTENGYHVILRQFDLVDIQDVRVAIRESIAVRKQQESFAALLDGLRADATIRLYTSGGVITLPRPTSLERFATCVGRSATLYGAPWSESYLEQIALFDSAYSLLTIVDCDENPARCNAAGIQKYPTWMIDGDSLGSLTPVELAKRTGCDLPS